MAAGARGHGSAPVPAGAGGAGVVVVLGVVVAGGARRRHRGGRRRHVVRVQGRVAAAVVVSRAAPAAGKRVRRPGRVKTALTLYKAGQRSGPHFV